MSRIFWDTNLYIYLFEDFGECSKRTVDLRNKMLARGDQLLTSTLTLAEILVKPTAEADQELCQRYEAVIAESSILLPFDRAAARIFAQLRQDRSLRPPDIIQLACAAAAGIDLFITNDRRLHAKMVPRIQFIAALDQVPL